MTDIRETLNEIQQRADAASRMLMTGSKPWLVRDSAIDVPRLVAALRAVLDLHPTEFVTYATFAGSAGGGEVCALCKTPSPCRTARAITEALGGDA